ncbi:TlyA family RNA methyltransferase [Anoxynatronum buryatiense]|uniref:23S rRNA (Cytidine1920-2'-O)/16S rRNA (Cytidine1409-2'-O)-methyltransferase n=1 Tax=Anoxynatronum buryatiense TaxID=489973 RepID=A0AA45WUV8_9CLOT|nr:TlyA family RNA methyltransferase [Anoxynatronum buryatiense]SMP48437.1 23S rRNA (cytidine1920-2'-O)/16S rRNA (cytidine1409-2'-O)-methyltransferase [Anoxynatronum buryatiense]
MAKQRIDLLLVEKGLFSSREKARAAIMAGQILADRERIDKAGTQVHLDAIIEIKGKPLAFVSRGGLKLEKAIEQFHLSLKEKVCMDIGASTGGFTDCMLQHGASRVYAVDVGYGQLDWNLRNDPRVVVMERTNIRYVTPEDLNEAMDMISIDVSFISLKLVLPVAYHLLKSGGVVVALIKPQFEAGKSQVGKNGVVRDAIIHEHVITEVASFATSVGFSVEELDFSPIRGPKGNVEFLTLLSKNSISSETVASLEKVKAVVLKAHQHQW